MSSPEILLNNSIIASQNYAVVQSASALRLGKLNANDSGNSAAIKEFVSIYDDFSSVVNEYITVLNSDLSRVMKAVEQINEVDRKEGILMQGLQSNVRYKR